jgi:hypothetical protein
MSLSIQKSIASRLSAFKEEVKSGFGKLQQAADGLKRSPAFEKAGEDLGHLVHKISRAPRKVIDSNHVQAGIVKIENAARKLADTPAMAALTLANSARARHQVEHSKRLRTARHWGGAAAHAVTRAPGLIAESDAVRLPQRFFRKAVRRLGDGIANLSKEVGRGISDLQLGARAECMAKEVGAALEGSFVAAVEGVRAPRLSDLTKGVQSFFTPTRREPASATLSVVQRPPEPAHPSDTDRVALEVTAPEAGQSPAVAQETRVIARPPVLPQQQTQILQVTVIQAQWILPAPPASQLVFSGYGMLLSAPLYAILAGLMPGDDWMAFERI